tara:strand:- start:291 stop:959 length:669 start_codon:yes stop_codon:yes gene_type:complete
MLVLKNVSKTFESNSIVSNTEIFHNINLNIKQGSIIALTGPSGVGKSTLLNLISGIDSVSSGLIKINNQIITSLKNDDLCRFRNNNIGIIFQFFNLLNDLSVFENIAMPLLLRGDSKKSITHKVDKIINIIGLSDRSKYTTNLLSGGEAQRVAIARALIINPSIIIADEPTGNLDKSNTDNIINILINLCRNNNSTLIMVTHDQDLLSHFDHVYKMDSGMII